VKIKKRDWAIIFEFLSIAAIIPFLCALFIIYAPIFSNGFLNLIVFGVQGLAPTLAAIITVMHNYSKNGLKSFLKDKYIANANPKICLLAFLTPMTLLIAAKALTVIYQNSGFELAFPNATKMLIIFWALIAEELGWRGFLQEKIESKIGAILTPFFVGVTWGLWHFHYFMTGMMDVPFALLLLGCIFESYGYFVITKLAKGNILPASIWHFSGNLFINLFLFTANDNYGSNTPYLIMTFVFAFCVIVFFCCQAKGKRRNERAE